MEQSRAIQITDRDVVRRVKLEQARRGDRGTARTAANMLREYLTILEERKHLHRQTPAA